MLVSYFVVFYMLSEDSLFFLCLFVTSQLPIFEGNVKITIFSCVSKVATTTLETAGGT